VASVGLGAGVATMGVAVTAPVGLGAEVEAGDAVESPDPAEGVALGAEQVAATIAVAKMIAKSFGISKKRYARPIALFIRVTTTQLLQVA
jgi:hypothetical protein